MALQWIKSLFGNKSDDQSGRDNFRSGSGSGSKGKNAGGSKGSKAGKGGRSGSGGSGGGGGSSAKRGANRGGGKIAPVSPSRARLERRANDEKIIRTIKIAFTTIIVVAVIGVALSIFLNVYKPSVATIGGKSISQYEFSYQLKMASNYASEYSTPETQGQQAIESAADAKIWEIIAREQGFSLTADDRDNIKAQLDYVDQLAASDTSTSGAAMTGDEYLRTNFAINKSQFRKILESESVTRALFTMEYDRIEVPDEDAQAKYDENSASYEEASVRHILFFYEGPDQYNYDEYSEDYDLNGDEDSLARTPEQSEQLALETVERINAGEDMIELVQELSEDGDLSNDGLYTFTRADSFEQGFLDWTFDPARQVGEVGICETSYGYHVMRLEDIHVIPFEEAKDEIVDQIKSDQVEAISEAWKNEPRFQLQINQKVLESVVEQIFGYYN